MSQALPTFQPASVSLLLLRGRGLLNAMRRSPLRHLLASALMVAVALAICIGVERGVRWIDGYPLIGSIADVALQRSLELFVTLLLLGVAFSALSNAITTLYTATDLPLLLSLPLPAARVFRLKVLETYLSSAALPALLTVPVVLGLGLARDAPPIYYPVAVAAILALYALPVVLGALLALLLMRLAPAGRVKEVSTALTVLLAAGLVLAFRAIRPEQLAELTPEQFEVFLQAFASLQLGAWPPGWAGTAVWQGLGGQVGPSLLWLLLLTSLAMWLLTATAVHAYQAGWVRGLDVGGGRSDARPRPVAWWERPLARLGPWGGLVVKDLRTQLRDPSQWSQLLVLLALAGVYLVGTTSVPVEGQRFRDILGTLNLAFLSFLLAGVGTRLAFPALSAEGEGLWLLRTAPLSVTSVIMAKLALVLPPLLLLGLGLGAAQALLLDVSSGLASASWLAGGCAAVAVACLGVGLGAAFPRFDATQVAEVPMSPGGLLYMAMSLVYAAGLTLLLAFPALAGWLPPDGAIWATRSGAWAAVLAVVWTLAFGGAALLLGIARFRRWEPGKD